MNNISIIEGDITKAIDAIVNAANPVMLGGGGVDGAIHKAAGPKLFEECQKINAVNNIRCPVGEARIILAGNLPSKFVIHTVGPIYRQERDPKGLLSAAYSNSLKLALKSNCRSIAFPAISCGVYGYPAHEAAAISIQTCSFATFKNIQVFFYLHGSNMYNIWQSTLKR